MQTVFYLQENQSWEIALLYFLKSKNVRAIGVPHATIRYWDLRYFYDQRFYNQDTRCALPLPNQAAINGDGAKLQLLKSGFPSEMIADVETLRYMFLNKIAEKSKLRTKQSSIQSADSRRLSYFSDR
ncbi:hypothetical protein [Leptospira noguchii]|uniref:hypothetical protein n=1 Tax=Leptospira noguchii TaxID=28182 RepID=UPI0011464AA7|nr:hypothetical protein [Leptospira noguchii]TQE83109.1 hypothetical protein FF021_02355 [Leptospira noguchii]UOG54029.1 hypothetical protein MAL09_08040 [Leptospira noguchii]